MAGARFSEKEMREYCLAFPGATANVQWGNDLVFKVGGKMFVCMGTDGEMRYSFKCADTRFLELTDQPGVAPAPYLARAKWVQVDPAQCRLPRRELRALLRESYDLVAAKLTKKLRRELGIDS